MDIQEQQLEELEIQQSQLPQFFIPTTPESNVKTVANSKNNTFSTASIIPIIRTVQIHPYCYAIYSTLHKIPLAVHQFLDKTMVEGKGFRKRKVFYQQKAKEIEDQKFYIDSSYYDQAYKTMSYDKGHMAPANNYLGNQDLLDSTFTYANCIPQNSYFNRGSWKNLQSYTRNFLRDNLCETVQVISGPVFYSEIPHPKSPNFYENRQVVMKNHGIIVPPKCFKIIKANAQNSSYLGAFVMRNEKFIDNEFLLKSFMVSIEQLEMMTGLRFNLGNCKPLEELDPTGLNQTMGDLHLSFYTKLFKRSLNLTEMNAARLQGLMYKVKIDIDCISAEERIKMAEDQYKFIISQNEIKPTEAKARWKINTLLGLHRNAKGLEALSQDLQKNIINSIIGNIEQSKNEDQTRYHKLIAKKIYEGNNQQYSYPCLKELQAAFSNVLEKKEDIKDVSQTSVNENEETDNSNTIPIAQKILKKTNETPKKKKQTSSSVKKQKQQPHQKEQQDDEKTQPIPKSKKQTKKKNYVQKQVHQDQQTKTEPISTEEKEKEKKKKPRKAKQTKQQQKKQENKKQKETQIQLIDKTPVIQQLKQQDKPKQANDLNV